jgi:hypothetical protein
MQLSFRLPFRIQNSGRGSIPLRDTEKSLTYVLDSVASVFSSERVLGVFGGIEQSLEPIPPRVIPPMSRLSTQWAADLRSRIETLLVRGHGAIRQRLSAPVFVSRLS